jgi:hypothetical protein
VGCCSGVTAGALSKWTIDGVLERVRGRTGPAGGFSGDGTVLARSKSNGALSGSEETDGLTRNRSCQF